MLLLKNILFFKSITSAQILNTQQHDDYIIFGTDKNF